MKKLFQIRCLLLIFMFCSFFENAFALKKVKDERTIKNIVLDEMIDSTRIVEVAGKTELYFSSTLTIALQCWANPIDTSYVLITNFSSYRNIKSRNDGILLLKNFDDEIIELHSFCANNFSKEDRLTNPSVTISHYKSTSFASYNEGIVLSLKVGVNYWLIKEEDLLKLEKGLKKIKIRLKNKDFEKEWKQDKFGEMLINSYHVLKEYIKTNQIENFREGF